MDNQTQDLDDQFFDEEREAEVKQKPRAKPNLYRVLGWLNTVDKHFITVCQLQLIKLSFRGDEPQIFRKIQDKESLSEVYQIVYTLKLIGHRNFGERAIKLLREEYSELNPEEYNPRNATMLVQLYQCLSQIASRLSVDQEKALRKYFTDSWGIHPEAQVARDAFSLFSHLVQTRKVTIHNQLELARGLKAADKSVHHFHYLMEYRNRNLDSIDEPQQWYLDIFPGQMISKSSVAGGDSSHSNLSHWSSDEFCTTDDKQCRVTSSRRNTSATLADRDISRRLQQSRSSSKFGDNNPQRSTSHWASAREEDHFSTPVPVPSQYEVAERSVDNPNPIPVERNVFALGTTDGHREQSASCNSSTDIAQGLRRLLSSSRISNIIDSPQHSTSPWAGAQEEDHFSIPVPVPLQHEATEHTQQEQSADNTNPIPVERNVFAIDTPDRHREQSASSISLTAHNSRVHWGWKFTCTTLSLLAVASLLVIGFSGYILTGAQSTHEMKDEILVYSNSVIPLADHLHPFYLSEIDLTLVTGENFCKVDFYLINKACSSLDPDEENSHSHLQTDKVKEHDNHMIFTGWYLLQNSFVKYNICAVTNSSYENSTNPILLEMYILNTLNETCISNTDQVPPRASKFADISVCYESRMERCTQECKIITFTADHEAYYSVRFFLNYPDLSTTMRYTFIREVRKYSYPHLRSNLDIVVHHCSLEPTKTLKKCALPLKDPSYHFPWNVNREQCVLADIHGKHMESGEISDIELSTSLYQPDWLLISAIIVGVVGCVFAVLFVSDIGVCFCIYRKCKGGVINVADTERENLLSDNEHTYSTL